MKLAHTTHTRTHAHTHTHTHAAAHHFWLFLLALHRAEKKPPSLGAPSTVTCFQAAVSWLACFLPKNSPSKSRSASAPTFACIMCGECMMSSPPPSLSPSCHCLQVWKWRQRWLRQSSGRCHWRDPGRSSCLRGAISQAPLQTRGKVRYCITAALSIPNAHVNLTSKHNLMCPRS